MTRALWIIVIGILIHLAGAWMKIVHRPHADFTLVVAYTIEAAGLVWLIYTAFFKSTGKRSK